MAMETEEFRRLIETHQRMVFSLALRIAGEYGTAEEVAQDVLLALHRSGEGLESEDHVRFWPRRVTVHRATARRPRQNGQRHGRDEATAVTELPARPTSSPGSRVAATLSEFESDSGFHFAPFSWIIDKDERGLTAPLSEAQLRIWQQGPLSPVSRRANRAESTESKPNASCLPAEVAGQFRSIGEQLNARNYHLALSYMQEPKLLHHQEQEDDHRPA